MHFRFVIALTSAGMVLLDYFQSRRIDIFQSNKLGDSPPIGASNFVALA
jgi:hypothetical protein